MLSVIEFQRRWRDASKGLSERSAYQQHFLNLCELFDLPTPAEVDATGASYTFEKGATKSTGGKGFADVWRRGVFAIEYKGAHSNLDKAYDQLLRYADALENPPILIVCDLETIILRTHFTSTPVVATTITLDDLGDPDTLAILRRALTEPDTLRPRTTTAVVTEEAARRFGALAQSLHARGYAPQPVAHFLMQVLFCLFAEDSGLLPRGEFTRLLTYCAKYPADFPAQIGQLLTAMRDGGVVNYERIDRFNGGLFVHTEPLPLTADELNGLVVASRLDWSAVEPAIFGTLFERGLDPSQRAALGAHYTGRADIERVVDPVLMVPLRRRWASVRAGADRLKTRWDKAAPGAASTRARSDFVAHLTTFQEELSQVRVLDPACGSGNFLYVALARLLDLEKEVITYGAANGLPAQFPLVGPRQLHGIEINQYAHELAQVVVWIGYLQWRIGNGFTGRRDPVLDPLETIEHRDALLARAAGGTVHEAAWPAADVIIGNPPFLGGKMLRSELGDRYVDELFDAYRGAVARESDLCCYFFEKARHQIASDTADRAGLLATNSIRGGANRRVLERIKQSGDIFMAWDDEPWVLNGAAVRISIVGFDDGSETERLLDGAPAESINPDLTGSIDITRASVLLENRGIAFMGDTKGGAFDVTNDIAQQWLRLPVNPNGRPNSDVVKPWVNGLDITRRPRNMWIIDFGTSMSEADAALYEAPFAHVVDQVLPKRRENKRDSYRMKWWLHAEPRPGMRAALKPLSRYVITPTVAKYRLFVWTDGEAVSDHQLIAFARDDNYFFGVLQSRAHEVWSLRMGTWLGKGNDPRYTPTTCFETFALPWPPGAEPTDDPRYAAIAVAARRLDELRRNWLDPEGADAATLKRRTLTTLYNERPTWLRHAHAALDRAVWDAYGWPPDETPADVPDDTILARLLTLNGERSAG